MTSKTFKTLHTWDTKFSADSVEWCPISPYKNVFACGTYFLNDTTKTEAEVKDKKEYHRIGTITVFAVNKNNLGAKHIVDCPAVLDIKWSPKKVSGNIALAAANAAGEINLFYFEDYLLKFITKCNLKKEFGDFLVLSLDWIKSASPDLICSSDSQGNITLIKVAFDALQVLKKWKAHSLEAWIVCFDSFHYNSIYSGGDDADMKVWDCRFDVLKIASFTEHKAGVTALNSNIYKENSLVSGSYDEIVNFWDVRNLEVPLRNIAASGGVWRLKWEPQSRSRYLLAACIYGGFQIYDISSYSVAAEYKEHESLAYGADWCYFDNKEVKSYLNCEESALIATCSFYDHKLCVSLWNESLNTHS